MTFVGAVRIDDTLDGERFRLVLLVLKKNMQEAHQLAKAQLQTSKVESKNRYDQTLKFLKLNPGDKVMIQEKQNKGKLAPKWLGPYSVIESHSDSPNITILKKNKPAKLHKNLFKKFHE